jgi:HD-like signal output (HDOD) protein
MADEQIPPENECSFSCSNCQGNTKSDRASDPPQKSSSSPFEATGEKFGIFVPSTDSFQKGVVDKALRRRILDAVAHLPPMPQIAHKARSIMSNPSSSFKDLAIVLVTDQTIASRVLKLANSAYFGLSGKVSSIQYASIVLGQKTLAELITVAAASSLMGQALKGYGMEAGDLWKHSLAVAYGSRFIAKNINSRLEDDAFSAGLIHDVGKLVLDKYIFEKKQIFEQLMGDGQETLLSAEKRTLGFDHAEIASEVCDQWNVPENLASAIRYHHYPVGSQGNGLAYILYLADVIANKSRTGGEIETLSYEVDDEVVKFLGFKKEDMPKILSQVTASVQEAVQALE